MNQKNICYNCFRELEEDTTGSCPHCGYDPQDKEKYPLALPHGTVLNGRYITGRVLGQGGFGVTYVASDWKTKQRVAIKEYLPDTMATRMDGRSVSAYSGERGDSFEYGKECFLKEAQTLAEFIGNPNIVRVHSYFEEYGTAYFVMDYIEGTSFQEYIREHGGKIPWQEAEKILLPIMDALDAVHGKGIVHRDVTPDNIFMTEDGTVKLLDFGAARYSLGDKSRSLDVVLKHGFAPKEQYTRHGRQGSYTDVYTVAASFYYAVTGRKPPDSIDRIEEDDLVPPSSLGIDIPVNVENAILKGMGVQPADRYQSMAEFKKALLQDKKEEPREELKQEPREELKQEPLPSKDEPNKELRQQTKKKKNFGLILGCTIGGVVIIVFWVNLILAFIGGDSENSTGRYSDKETEKTVETGKNHGMADINIFEETAAPEPAAIPEPPAVPEPTVIPEPTATQIPTPTPEMEKLDLKWDLKKNKKIPYTYVAYSGKEIKGSAKITQYKIGNAKKSGYKKLTMTIIFDETNQKLSRADIDQIGEKSKNGSFSGESNWISHVDYNTGFDASKKKDLHVTEKITFKEVGSKKYESSNWFVTFSKYKFDVSVTYPEDYDGLCVGIFVGPKNLSGANKAFTKGKKSFGETSFYKKYSSHWMRVKN